MAVRLLRGDHPPDALSACTIRRIPRLLGALLQLHLPGLSRREANPYVDIPVATGLGEARNIIVVRTSQAVIAVDGEYGTLSEIAYALKLGIPVVGLNTWQLAKEGRLVSAIVEAATPAEAVDKALALAI